DASEFVAFDKQHRAERRLANARRVRQYSLEHRVERARRARDNLQHFGGRGLPLQRLGKLFPRLGEFFFRSALAARRVSASVLAFVPVERSLRPRVGLFAPLRDKVTSSAQSLVPFRSGPAKDRAYQS